MRIWVCLALVFVSAALADRPFNLRLKLEETAGVERICELVSMGVPFPKGAMSPYAGFTMSDEKGKKIPLQYHPTARWEDGSLKWVLLRFPVSVEAGGVRNFNLRVGKQDIERRVWVRFCEHDVEIITPTLKLLFPHDRFSIFEGLYARREGEKAWKQIAGDGGDFVLVDMDGKEYRAGWDRRTYKMEILERGPDAAVLRCSGKMRAEDGSSFGSFRVYITVSGFSPFVKADFIYIADIPQRWERIKMLAVTSPWLDEAALWEVGVDGRKIRGEGLENIVLISQTGPSTWVAEDVPFSLKVFKGGKLYAKGARGEGWVLFHDDTGFIWGVSIRRFWQRHPARIELERGRFKFYIVPERDEGFQLVQGLSLSVSTGWFIGYSEMQEAVCALRGFEQPLIACPPTGWLTGSQVFGIGPLPDLGKGEYPRYKEGMDIAFQSLMERRGRLKEYGLLNYGDWSYERYQRGWGNVEYDLPHCAFMLWAMTGERGYFDLGVDSAIHYRDTDIHHYDADGGYNHTGAPMIHGTDHFSRTPDGIPAFATHLGHMWVEGLLEHYFLTGDLRSLEVAREVGEFLKSTPSIYELETKQCREIGWPIICLVELYEATGDMSCFNAASQLVERALEHQYPEGYWATFQLDPSGLWCYSAKPFMMGILLEGLIRYHMLTKDPKVAKSIVKACYWLVDEAWVEEDKGFIYTTEPSNMDGGRLTDVREMAALGYAYVLCGEEKFLEVAKKQYQAFVEDMGHFDGVNGKGFAIRSRSLPHFLGILDMLEGR